MSRRALVVCRVLALLVPLGAPAWADCEAPPLAPAAGARTAVLDGLQADAAAAQALEMRGSPEAARLLLIGASERAETRLVLLGGPDDPALGAVLRLGMARNELDSTIASAMLEAATPTPPPAVALARALALFDWAGQAWAALPGCGSAAGPTQNARARGAMIWAEVLAREALVPLAAVHPAAVRAANEALNSLTMLPPPDAPGDAALARQVAAQLVVVRAAMAPLMP